MRRSVLWICMAALCLTTLIVPAIAQEDSTTTSPKVLQITREEVKPGKAAAHIASETAWTRALKNANYEYSMLAMTSVTGTPEAWFLSGYPNFATYEKANIKWDKDPAIHHISETYDPKESEFVNESRTVLAVYQPEDSYKADVKIGEYKYVQIGVIRFRLGEDVSEFYKALNSAREKAGLDTHTAVYAVRSGMPSGTYISLTPMKSIAEWDAPPNEAYTAALKDIGWSQLIGKYIMNSEFRVFSFSPEMSMPTKSMIAANPGYWSPKPMMAKKAEPVGAEKATPAAKKEMKK